MTRAKGSGMYEVLMISVNMKLHLKFCVINHSYRIFSRCASHVNLMQLKEL
jgi:hypothetical protein